MPQLCAGTSNTPLWSLILAKTDSFSWLGEVNRLVCVTLSQVATTLLVGGHVYSSRYPWAFFFFFFFFFFLRQPICTIGHTSLFGVGQRQAR